MLQSNRILSPLTSLASHAFKTALIIHVYEQYHKWFQLLSSYLPRLFILPHPSLHSFCARARVVCVCVRARAGRGGGGEEYNIMTIIINYYFWGFTVCIIADLVKCSVLTLVGEMRRYRNDRYYYYYYCTSHCSVTKPTATCTWYCCGHRPYYYVYLILIWSQTLPLRVPDIVLVTKPTASCTWYCFGFKTYHNVQGCFN